MALKEYIKITAQDRSGRVLTLQNKTGTQEMGVDTGYGPDNGQITDVLAYILDFSRIESNFFSRITINEETELSRVLQGYPTKVHSGMFADQTTEGAAMFSDGVVNVDSYSVWEGLTGLSIVKGESFITGGNFTNTLKGNAILVGDVIYQIDISRSDIGGQVLYIIGEFQEDAVSFSILYQGNTKALLQAVTDNQHAYIVAKLSNTPPSQQSLFRERLNDALHFKIAALGFVKHCADWHKANDLVVGASKILNKILASWR